MFEQREAVSFLVAHDPVRLNDAHDRVDERLAVGGRDQSRVNFVGGGWQFEPSVDLFALINSEVEPLHNARDEVAFMGMDLEICPGEGADELHQLHAFVIVEVLQHGLLLVGRSLLRAMTNGDESAN